MLSERQTLWLSKKCGLKDRPHKLRPAAVHPGGKGTGRRTQAPGSERRSHTVGILRHIQQGDLGVVTLSLTLPPAATLKSDLEHLGKPELRVWKRTAWKR